MKQNIAPDKIYMPNELLSEEWQRHIEGEDIEYVRADILIEKVCNFIRINAYKYRKIKFVKNKPTFDFRTDWLIEDLRNYMKGE